MLLLKKHYAIGDKNSCKGNCIKIYLLLTQIGQLNICKLTNRSQKNTMYQQIVTKTYLIVYNEHSLYEQNVSKKHIQTFNVHNVLLSVENDSILI